MKITLQAENMQAMLRISGKNCDSSETFKDFVKTLKNSLTVG